MTRKSLFIIALLAVSLSSCVYALFPIYTPETIVFKKELLGIWETDSALFQLRFEVYDETKAKGQLNFRHRHGSYQEVETDKSYKLTIYDLQNPEATESFQAHLVRLGDHHFLDLIPLLEHRNDNLGNNFMALHSFAKVRIQKEGFVLSQFDLTKLNELFESNLIRLRHENVNGTVLITAQSEELQKFLKRYAADQSVFEESEYYHKVRP